MNVPADVDRFGAVSPRSGTVTRRHTAATLLLSESVHSQGVMELLGQSQMRTTMDVYGHVMPRPRPEAADRTGAPAAAG